MSNTGKYITQNGYNYYPLVSALQKDIRRGNERQAVFWALELQTYKPYLLWSRLIIIASEDIGPANNNMAILIDILHKRYQEHAKKRGESKGLFLIHAVLALCRSPKSREVDELLCITLPEVGMGINLPAIPDYACDMHTRTGKAMGRGIEHFYKHGAVISPTSFPPREGEPDWHSPYTAEVAAFEDRPDVKEYFKSLKYPSKKKVKVTEKKVNNTLDDILNPKED